MTESIGFQQAVDQALARNPSTLTAVQEVDRIHGLMEEIRAASIPTLAANLNFTHLDSARTEVGPVTGTTSSSFIQKTDGQATSSSTSRSLSRQRGPMPSPRQ